MKALFCIVSDHAPANMNSINELNPDYVILAVSERMQANSENLSNELKNMGKKVSLLPISQEFSRQALNQQYETWIEQNIDKFDEIIVNITGGTKPMSISAYNIFGGLGFRCFYQSLDPNHLVWLDDESVIPNIGHNINLERYLRMYHFTVEKKVKLADIPQAYKQYANQLYEALCYPQAYPSMLTTIAKINAHVADKKLDLTHFQFDKKELALLQELSNETQLFTLKDNQIVCHDLADKAIMAGGWLEVLTAEKLAGSNYRDICQSVYLSKSTQRKTAQTNQEIDVMAMQANTLVMIECKTKKWQTATEASGSIYKLSALGDIGGLNTKPIFVSLHDLPPSAKTRAAEMGIRVIAGQDDITHLKSRLAK